jgi:hypothetical protein
MCSEDFLFACKIIAWVPCPPPISELSLFSSHAVAINPGTGNDTSPAVVTHPLCPCIWRDEGSEYGGFWRQLLCLLRASVCVLYANVLQTAVSDTAASLRRINRTRKECPSISAPRTLVLPFELCVGPNETFPQEKETE